jgi:hypothetical protein
MFTNIGVIKYHQRQQERFKNGELIKEWYKQFPDIFDEIDLKIALNQASMGYHFYEWLAAIVLFQTYGFYSLVEQYEFKTHKRKQDLLKHIVSKDIFDLITNHKRLFKGVQCPDLFVYSPDHSEWFFCEVKGNRDKIRNNQITFFDALAEKSQKPIYVIQLKLQGNLQEI